MDAGLGQNADLLPSSLLDHEEGLDAEFSDIAELIHQCRFSDCQHQTEPDCAIQQVLSNVSRCRWLQ